MDGYPCAITGGGGVMCWGDDTVGELGNTGTTCLDGPPCSVTPVQVTGLTSGVTAVSGGAYEFSTVCAIVTSGRVECWGSPLALGNGSMTSSSVPVEVNGF